MTQIDLELELATLRRRRSTPGVTAWLRQFRPFDRRAIREPGERDAYWAAVQQRLAESDAAFILGSRATGGPTEGTPEVLLIG